MGTQNQDPGKQQGANQPGGRQQGQDQQQGANQSGGRQQGQDQQGNRQQGGGSQQGGNRQQEQQGGPRDRDPVAKDDGISDDDIEAGNDAGSIGSKEDRQRQDQR